MSFCIFLTKQCANPVAAKIWLNSKTLPRRKEKKEPKKRIIFIYIIYNNIYIIIYNIIYIIIIIIIIYNIIIYIYIYNIYILFYYYVI